MLWSTGISISSFLIVETEGPTAKMAHKYPNNELYLIGFESGYPNFYNERLDLEENTFPQIKKDQLHNYLSSISKSNQSTEELEMDLI